ncbi:MAG TPA: helix-turn-helix transcriptional regulator [Solirubrobacterales bacterium]|jgi:transcriptional regulator with XRE-family HTH domain
MEETAKLVAQIVGPRIRRIRRAQEMSQETLGYLAEVNHHGPISKIEHGEQLPRLDTLIKLAAGIGVSPCELLDGIVWEPPGVRSAGPDGRVRGWR